MDHFIQILTQAKRLRRVGGVNMIDEQKLHEIKFQIGQIKIDIKDILLEINGRKLEGVDLFLSKLLCKKKGNK